MQQVVRQKIKLSLFRCECKCEDKVHEEIPYSDEANGNELGKIKIEIHPADKKP